MEGYTTFTHVLPAKNELMQNHPDETTNEIWKTALSPNSTMETNEIKRVIMTAPGNISRSYKDEEDTEELETTITVDKKCAESLWQLLNQDPPPLEAEAMTDHLTVLKEWKYFKHFFNGNIKIHKEEACPKQMLTDLFQKCIAYEQTLSD